MNVSRFWFLTAGLSAAGALLMLRSLLFTPGMPAFQHDWGFPLNGIQIEASFAEYTRPWLTGNFGMPNVYGFSYPLAIWYRMLAPVLSAHGILTLTLLLALASGGTGAAVLTAKIVGRRGIQCFLASFVFICMPFTLNELGAGHVSEIVAFCALPWVFLIVYEWPGYSAAAAVGVGLLAIVTGVQPQYGVFAFGIIVLAGIVSPARWRWIVPAIGAFAVGEIATIAIYGIIRAPLWLPQDAVTARWESIQSSQWYDAIAGLGYAAGYAINAYGAAYVALRSVELALAAAATAALLSACRRNGLARALLLCGLFGFLGGSGTRGPLAMAISFTFDHFAAAAMFRELYHFESLVTLSIAVGAGVAVGLLASSSKIVPRLSATALSAAALAVVVTAFSRVPLNDVPRVAPSHAAALARAVRWIADQPGNTRVLFVPALQPMGPKDTPYAGIDVDAFTVGAHPAVSDFQPTATVEFASRVFSEEPAGRAAAELGALGIQYVVVRRNWISKRLQRLEPSERALRKSCNGPEGPAITQMMPAWSSGNLDIYALPMPLTTWRTDAAPPAFEGRPALSKVFDDPRTGWVDGARWADCFTQLAAAPFDSAFTIGARTVTLANPRHLANIVLWAPDGAIVRTDFGTRRVRSAGPATVATGRSASVTLYSSGRTAVWGLTNSENVLAWMRQCGTAARCRYVIAATTQSPLWSLPPPAHRVQEEAQYPAAWELPVNALLQGSSTRLERTLRVLMYVQFMPWILFAVLALRSWGVSRAAVTSAS